MATARINGVTLHYEILGEGPPVALTPGGRAGREGVRSLAAALADCHRVLIYDRRNCGASDVLIGGELSEQEIWAEDLHLLLQHLGMRPAFVGGGSAGCRVSLLLAIRHPEDVRGLLLWMVTGGLVAAERLGHNYYGQFIEAAVGGGMAAVIETPFFAERIAQNPSNRERLLTMDPAEFCTTMARWRSFFTQGADLPVIGATEEELRRIAIPALIVSGNDEIHPWAVGEGLHRLLQGSKLAPPLLTETEEASLREQGLPALSEERMRRMARLLADFLAATERPSPSAVS